MIIWFTYIVGVPWFGIFTPVAQVWFLVWELWSHIRSLHIVAKKIKRKETTPPKYSMKWVQLSFIFAYRWKKKKMKKKKYFFFVMRNLNIYPFNNFLIYYTLPLAIVIILYITSLVLIYLITESLCILITFFQYPPMLSTSINHKSGLFFHEFFFVCLFRFHIFMKSCSICLSLTYFASHNALMVFQMVEFPCVFFFFFFFLGPHPQPMWFSRLGVHSELQLLAYTTATETWDPSGVLHLHHSSGQRQILNPLSEIRDRTCVLMDASQICFCWATMGTLKFWFFFLSIYPWLDTLIVSISWLL